METKARSIFRRALAAHYIDGGIEAGEVVEAWLKSHRGWLPDPGELYGDGTPLTQPADEGDAVASPYPLLAVKEAKNVMTLLRNGLQSKCFKEDLSEEEGRLLVDARKWLGDEELIDRRRSRSPRRNTEVSLPHTDRLIKLHEDRIAALEAQITRLESEIALKNSIIAAYRPAFTGFQGVQASPYSH